MPSLTTIISTASVAFLASLVEFVEAFTIVLAVGLTHSWRPAFTGSALAAFVLAALVLLLGPLLTLVPLAVLQFAIGDLLFGGSRPRDGWEGRQVLVVAKLRFEDVAVGLIL